MAGLLWEPAGTVEYDCPQQNRGASNPDRSEARVGWSGSRNLLCRLGPPNEKFAVQSY